MARTWMDITGFRRTMPVILIMALGVAGAGRSSPARAADVDSALEQQCQALIDGDMKALRSALHGQPLRAFADCPHHPGYTFASIATDRLPQAQWETFRELTAPADRGRLNDMRLLFVLRLVRGTNAVKDALDVTERLLDDSALPRDDDGQVRWSGAADLLDVLDMPAARASDDDKARATRIFFDRLLTVLPAERHADLSSLWKPMLKLPEPRLLEALQVLKQRFGAYSPSSGAAQAAGGADYPLKSAAADEAIRADASLTVVLALVDLRQPAPPMSSAWSAAIDGGRMDVLDTFLRRGYAIPQEQQQGTWVSPILGGTLQLDTKGDGRALDRMLASLHPGVLRPEIADRLLLTALFAQPKPPHALALSERWRYVDRIRALGADPNRVFNNKAEVGMRWDITDLIRRSPDVALGVLDHGLRADAPMLPAGGNMLSNYLMVVRATGEVTPDLTVIKGMLQHKNLINTFDSGVEHFPLEFAVMNHSQAFAKAFFALGVDIHVRDPHGYGQLTRAAAYGYAPLVQFLLDAGADPNESTPDGASPLDYAQCKNHGDVVALLQAHHAIAKGTLKCGGAG